MFLDHLLQEDVSAIHSAEATSPSPACRFKQPLLQAAAYPLTFQAGTSTHEAKLPTEAGSMDGWMSPDPATPDESDEEIALRTSSRISIDEVPHKNTFIHYDIVKSPRARPSTPTHSAPGALLSRLFKTRAAVERDNSVNDAGLNSHRSMSTCSCDSLPSTLPEVATIVTQTDDLDQYSKGNESGSSVGSPLDAGIESTNCTINFSVNGQSAQVELHRLGQCMPCNYFWYKIDGCRQGADCTFCHFCPKGEINKRKKDKMRQLRKAGALRK